MNRLRANQIVKMIEEESSDSSDLSNSNFFDSSNQNNETVIANYGMFFFLNFRSNKKILI